ncbi:MAG TPA: 1,4-alpha-glucan branching protein GlgB [Candidatus Limnocylindria bacterium]|nr:1,4-alpha-glucan branching protein GlgB [Candidatus Limnocylindria bacterium]
MTSLVSDYDLHLMGEGTHARLYEHLGAHVLEGGVGFAVWAPNARTVSVLGDWNDWDERRNVMLPRGGGVWETFVPGIGAGAAYKLRVVGPDRARADKADPLAFRTELPPKTASVVTALRYDWHDGEWLERRRSSRAANEPWSIYEVHLGSWRRVPEEGDRFLTYRELAPLLAEHALRHGFTHVELLPVMEHPFYGSWGYQTTGYFAPTARHGAPEDLMSLIDHLHGRGIGVILDWVPSHFPDDAHGLAWFDGTHLYEHDDRRQRVHPDWKSHIFNYDRHEVRSFLLSSAHFWVHRYHADALRVDAVASMLRLDYSRAPGTWVPNRFGGRENLGAIDFLRELNRHLYAEFPGVETIAEESHAWPQVSRPVYTGGLGFGMKWDLGWMHDTLDHLQRDPVHRRWHHGELTFRTMYAFTESFVLPLSHDEVSQGKGSLVERFPGDAWRKLATLRLLFAYQHAQPGKKLLFQGGEFGQWREWHHDRSLDWHLLDDAAHAGVARCVADLNRLHRGEPALHELDFDPAGFEWADHRDAEHSVLAILRHAASGAPSVLCVLNFTPVVRHDYRLGVPAAGRWTEVLNTDALEYGGSGVGNAGGLDTEEVPSHDRPSSLRLTLPPLAALFLRAPS